MLLQQSKLFMVLVQIPILSARDRALGSSQQAGFHPEPRTLISLPQ